MARAKIIRLRLYVFLGLVTHMSIYVRDFAKIAATLTNLLKGRFEAITWISNCHASFEALK